MSMNFGNQQQTQTITTGERVATAVETAKSVKNLTGSTTAAVGAGAAAFITGNGVSNPQFGSNEVEQPTERFVVNEAQQEEIYQRALDVQQGYNSVIDKAEVTSIPDISKSELSRISDTLQNIINNYGEKLNTVHPTLCRDMNSIISEFNKAIVRITQNDNQDQTQKQDIKTQTVESVKGKINNNWAF